MIALVNIIRLHPSIIVMIFCSSMGSKGILDSFGCHSDADVCTEHESYIGSDIRFQILNSSKFI